MSLFDHFEQQAGAATTGGFGGVGSSSSSIIDAYEPTQSRFGVGMGNHQEQFILDKVQFKFPNLIQDFVVENNILVVACGPSTSTNTSTHATSSLILWIDLDKPDSIVEIPLPISGQISGSSALLERVFLSPLAQGLIISTSTGGNYFYYPQSPAMSTSSITTPGSATIFGGALSKPRLLSKTKGRISAVAWPVASLRGSILIGTRGGAVYDLEVSPTDTKKFEKSCVQVMQGQDAIFGLHYSYMPCGLVVYVATSTVLSQFIGPRDTVSTGSLLLDPSAADVQEIPGDRKTSNMKLYSNLLPSTHPPTTLVWLTGPGIYTGAVLSGNGIIKQPGDSSLDNVVIVPYPAVKGLENAPISIAISEFHFILLTATECIILNRLDNQIQYTIPIHLGPNEKVVQLVSDSMRKTFWVATNESLYEIIVVDEDRDIWKIYFGRGQYKEAINIAKSNETKAFIAEKYADQSLKKIEYNLAAELYARTKLGIEEVSLRFLRLKLDTSKPLITFLTKRMALFKEVDDRSQTIMIGSWILELQLTDLDFMRDRVRLAASSNETLKSAAAEKEVQAITESIYSLMKTYKNRLHVPTVYSLLKQHGRQELQLYYAELISDHARICDIHLSNQDWLKALEVIGTQTTPQLIYKHSPLLILHIPSELVTVWKRCGTKFLNPRLLLPSMLTYEMQTRDCKGTVPASPGSGKTQIVTFLEHVISVSGCRDRVIHNYLFYLYVTSLKHPEKEAAVIEFIKSQQNNVCFDVQYALRICQQHRLLQASVQLYLVLDMQREAVSLALKSNDLDLAKGIVESIDEDEEDIRKQLWLQIAKHVITENKDYKKAMEMSKQGDLKIEQVLQFFPDFVQIDEVKEDLVQALIAYKKRLAELSRELDESANTTDLIRHDIRALQSRSVVVPILKKCDACHRSLMTRQFCVFPCHHAFHSDCIVTELIQYPTKSPRVKYLQSKANENAKTKDELDRFVGEECILCSDIFIRTIDIPLVDNFDAI